MCECIKGFFRTLLIIILLPIILILWFVGLIVFIFLFPCYCIGYCCCSANGCGYQCIDRYICNKWLCLPCNAFEWACSCCCSGGGGGGASSSRGGHHHNQKMKKPKKTSGGPKIPKAATRDKVYYAPRDGPNKENYVAKTGVMH